MPAHKPCKDYVKTYKNIKIVLRSSHFRFIICSFIVHFLVDCYDCLMFSLKNDIKTDLFVSGNGDGVKRSRSSSRDSKTSELTVVGEYVN